MKLITASWPESGCPPAAPTPTIPEDYCEHEYDEFGECETCQDTGRVPLSFPVEMEVWTERDCGDCISVETGLPCGLVNYGNGDVGSCDCFCGVRLFVVGSVTATGTAPIESPGDAAITRCHACARGSELYLHEWSGDTRDTCDTLADWCDLLPLGDWSPGHTAVLLDVGSLTLQPPQPRPWTDERGLIA